MRVAEVRLVRCGPIPLAPLATRDSRACPERRESPARLEGTEPVSKGQSSLSHAFSYSDDVGPRFSAMRTTCPILIFNEAGQFDFESLSALGIFATELDYWSGP